MDPALVLEAARLIAARVGSVLPDGLCFVLIVSDTGDEGTSTFVSDIESMPAVVGVLRELATNIEKDHQCVRARADATGRRCRLHIGHDDDCDFGDELACEPAAATTPN